MLYNIVMDKKGIALAAVILLITFVAVAVLGATSFIAQRLVGVEVKQRDMRCRYNAQAGLHYAIYQYRNSGTPYSGNNIAIDASNSFSVSSVAGGGGGGAASLLQINATGSSLGGSGSRDILGITLTNTSPSSSIRLDYFTISVTGGSKTLDQMRINGSDVWTTNTSIGTTPVTLNMNNVTIPASTTRALNFIRWTSGMSGRIVTLSFIMSDATTTSVCTVYPAPPSVCTTGGGTLTITSMGKTAGSGLYHTVQATYTTATGNISNYTETTATVP